jgi:type IV pilus biogenesis protein PilP
MHSLRIIALTVPLISQCAFAQQGKPVVQPVPVPPAFPAARPAPPERPIPQIPSAKDMRPVPPLPELAPLNPDFQAAMANSQLQTYRYSQLTEQALALKKLCETGFGPADICPGVSGGASGANADSSSPSIGGGLPTVTEINGNHGVLSAVLALEDGRHLTVHPGTSVPGGLKIMAITEDDVRVTMGSGRETTLYFAGIGASK